MGTENCTTAEHFQSRYQRGGWKLNAEKHVVPVVLLVRTIFNFYNFSVF